MNRNTPVDASELIAAMPIVILFSAMRAAWQRANSTPRAAFRHSQAH